MEQNICQLADKQDLKSSQIVSLKATMAGLRVAWDAVLPGSPPVQLGSALFEPATRSSPAARVPCWHGARCWRLHCPYAHPGDPPDHAGQQHDGTTGSHRASHGPAREASAPVSHVVQVASALTPVGLHLQATLPASAGSDRISGSALVQHHPRTAANASGDDISTVSDGGSGLARACAAATPFSAPGPLVLLSAPHGGAFSQRSEDALRHVLPPCADIRSGISHMPSAVQQVEPHQACASHTSATRGNQPDVPPICMQDAVNDEDVELARAVAMSLQPSCSVLPVQTLGRQRRGHSHHASTAAQLCGDCNPPFSWRPHFAPGSCSRCRARVEIIFRPSES